MRFCFLAPGQHIIDVLTHSVRTAGGAEAQLGYLAMTFAQLGHDVTVIYGSGGDGSLIQLQGITCLNAYPAWKRPRTILHFWKLLSEQAPALIYARLPDDFLWLAGLFAKLHPGTTFLYALANDAHCNPWQAYSYNGWFHNPCYALGLRLADIVSIQHAKQQPMVQPYTAARIVHIPNLLRQVGSQPRHFGEAHIDAIWIAQVRPQKQVSLFLELVERLPKLRFAIIGGFDALVPAHEQEQQRQWIERLPNLQFLGPRHAHEVLELLQDSKVLVNTSRTEGFPNTMLEAWSLGVPVVSLTIDPGGVIVREHLGLVSGNMNQLVQDVERLVMDATLNEKLGQRGYSYVGDHHSPAALLGAFEQVVSALAPEVNAHSI